MIPPCRDCKDRKMGCHSLCERYKQWAETRKRPENPDGGATAFLVEQTHFRKKRWGGQKK